MVEKIKEKRKILVTGSCGMLGVDLCCELQKNYNVIGVDICKTLGSIVCDITDREEIVKTIIGLKPDLIIHVAAWTDVDGCQDNPEKAENININGTENVSIAASKLDIPLFYISTDFVFDGKKKSSYTEEDLINPINVYGVSKLKGEEKVSSLNSYVIVRSGWLYGAGGKNFVDTILSMAKEKLDIKVVDDQIGSPTYTKDLAKAISILIDEGSYGKEVYNISNKGEISWFDYAKTILNISGMKDVKVMPITSEELTRSAKRPTFSVLDNSKFEKKVKFSMRNWKEALQEYINNG